MSWATQDERDLEFRMRTLSTAEATRRGIHRPRPAPLDQAALDAAHGLSRPERTIGGGDQLVLCPDCGSGGGRHSRLCQLAAGVAPG